MKKIYVLTSFVLALLGVISTSEAAVTNYSILTSRAMTTLGPSVATNCNSAGNSCNFFVGYDGTTTYSASAVTFTIDGVSCRNCTFSISGHSSNTIAITAGTFFNGTTAFNVIPTANNQTATISLTASPTFLSTVDFNVASSSAFTHTVLYLDAAGRTIPANFTNGATSIVSLFSNITLGAGTITGGTVIAANNTALTLGGDIDIFTASLVIGNNTTGTATLFLQGNNLFLHDGTSSIRLNTANNSMYDVNANSSSGGDVYYSSTANNNTNGLHNMYTGDPTQGGTHANTNESTTGTVSLPYIRTGASVNNRNFYVQGPSITTINTVSPNNANTKFTANAGASPLPVTLINFVAALKNDGTVALSWTTEQEVNSSYFIVLRSTDGSTWQSAGSVNAQGNSAVATNYSYTDAAAVSGVAYYRLQVVDLDGIRKFSDVRVVRSSIPIGIRVFPNPVTDYVNVYLDKPAASGFALKLINQNGQVLQQGKFTVGAYSTSMPVFTYPQGQYILQLSGPDGTLHTTKLFITRK